MATSSQSVRLCVTTVRFPNPSFVDRLPAPSSHLEGLRVELAQAGAGQLQLGQLRSIAAPQLVVQLGLAHLHVQAADRLETVQHAAQPEPAAGGGPTTVSRSRWRGSESTYLLQLPTHNPPAGSESTYLLPTHNSPARSESTYTQPSVAGQPAGRPQSRTSHIASSPTARYRWSTYDMLAVQQTLY